MRQYVVTDQEFMSLVDRLKLVECQRPRDAELGPDAQNRLAELHRKFHYEVVTWIQAMGCRELPR